MAIFDLEKWHKNGISLGESGEIMLFRKISAELEKFYGGDERCALLLTGARQVGKTFVVRETARRRFRVFAEVNFIKTPEAKNLFAHGMPDEKEFFVLLSAVTGKKLVPGETLVFFDEVQECPEAVTFVKFLVDDGRFRYVLSGSLLGVELNDLRSAPVGYLRELEMFPLDFEEFVRANGIDDDALRLVGERCASGGEVPAVLHDRLMRLFRLYLVVGGMPAVAQAYVDTNDLARVARTQRAIVAEYKRDAAKYDAANKMKIVRTLELVPSELDAKNKRFRFSDLAERGKFERLEDNFVWLAKAGVAVPVYNVDSPKSPLELAKKASLFKLFMNDVGLLASQYAAGIQLEILTGRTDVNFGAVYENFVAQELRAHGFDRIYYFSSKRHGEVDFLVETVRGAEPIEVKSGADFKAHKALDNVLAVGEYGLSGAKVLCNSPVVELGATSYFPIYATMFVAGNETPPELIYNV